LEVVLGLRGDFDVWDGELFEFGDGFGGGDLSLVFEMVIISDHHEDVLKVGWYNVF